MSRRLALLTLFVAGCYDGPLDLERMDTQSKVKAYQQTSYFPNGMALQVPPAGTVPRNRDLSNPELTEGVANGRITDRFPVEVTPELLARGHERYDIFCAPCHGVLGDGVSEVARNMALRPPPSLVDLAANWNKPPGTEEAPRATGAESAMGASPPVSTEMVAAPAPAPGASVVSGTGQQTEAMNGTPWDLMEPVRLNPPGNRHGPGGIYRTITNGFGLMPSYKAELNPIDRWAVVAYVRALQLSQRATAADLPPEQLDRLNKEGAK